MKPAPQKTGCEKVAVEIRRHIIPIIVAVATSQILNWLGSIAFVVIAAGVWLAWHYGWRIEFTNLTSKQHKEKQDANHHSAQ